tara:strand:+ start:4915 stop:5670 length:756 start_codon:yes stop_codon:yes gene_type:complete
MCTLFIYRKKHSDWPLLLAANRDEKLSRHSSPPNFHWKDDPDIYAGKDNLKGGSWLGINKHQVCAIILNRNTTFNKLARLSSRGNLVIDALKFKSAKEASYNIYSNLKNIYRNFNLFIADYKNAYWIKFENFEKSLNKVPFGFSMLDNFDLNDNSSKKQLVYRNIFSKIKIPDPKNNNFKEWEKMLFMKRKYKNLKNTEVFIYNKICNYGTVSSSIIGLPIANYKRLKPLWLYNEIKTKSRVFMIHSPFKN